MAIEKIEINPSRGRGGGEEGRTAWNSGGQRGKFKETHTEGTAAEMMHECVSVRDVSAEGETAAPGCASTPVLTSSVAV